jgi:hypothetical protein
VPSTSQTIKPAYVSWRRKKESTNGTSTAPKHKNRQNAQPVFDEVEILRPLKNWYYYSYPRITTRPPMIPIARLREIPILLPLGFGVVDRAPLELVALAMIPPTCDVALSKAVIRC